VIGFGDSDARRHAKHERLCRIASSFINSRRLCELMAAFPFMNFEAIYKFPATELDMWPYWCYEWFRVSSYLI
jgi:hypothetical protein